MATRLAAVFSHPIQYFAPLFRALAADAALELKVFFGSAAGAESYEDAGFGRSVRWDVPLLDGYASEIGSAGIGRRLAAFDPDVVWVHGYASALSLRALWWARRRAAVFTGDSELLQPRGAARRALKSVLLPALFRRIDVLVDYGERNREYYRHYGVPEQKMISGGYPLEIGRFQAARDALAEAGRAAARAALGLDPGLTTVVWAGKFVPVKRPLDLVDAIGRVRDGGGRVQALLIGSGPLQGEIERRVAEARLGGLVRLAGFVNQSAMPGVLALGDVVAMTSEREPYGLAIPEAMAAGNAVVASDRVGCVGADGVARPGVNAVVYPFGDVAALAGALAGLAAEPERLAGMQRASRELAWLQDVGRVARAMSEAALRAHRLAGARG